MFQERYGDAWCANKRYDRAMENYGNAYKIFAVDDTIRPTWLMSR